MGGRGGYRGRKRDEPRRRNPRESERTTMLNLHKLTTFRYTIREVMNFHKVDAATASPIIANIISKSSRISIASAKEYIREQEKLNAFSKDAADELSDLLDRFSKYR